jgi:tetratricopeptide (TPR) repeat protein
VGAWQRGLKPVRSHWPLYLGYVGALLVLVLAGSKLLLNGGTAVRSHDALLYLGRALRFAQERSLSATTGFEGSPDGAYRGDFHGFVFPAFLSHALLTTGDNPPGFPQDQAARAAFQITVLYMLLAVMALAGTSRYPGVGALAAVLLLLVPGLEYVSYHSSRDAFRIIPIMLLATVLTGLSPQRLRHRLRLPALLPPLVLAAFCLAGHTLGGLVVLMMAIAWTVWSLVHRTRWLAVALVLAAIGLGLLLGGFRYLAPYLETGTVAGQISSAYAVQGTALQGREPWGESLRMVEAATPLQRLAWLLQEDRYRLSVPGLVAALLALGLWAKSRGERRTTALPLVSMMLLAIFLPFTGLVDSGVYQFSTTSVANPRYALHWYPFAAITLAMLCAHGYEVLLRRHAGNAKGLLAATALALLVLVAAYTACRTVDTDWRTTASWDEGAWFAENVEPLQAVTGWLKTGERLVLDDDRYNYYLGGKAVVMYTRPTWGLIRARSEGEVESELEALDIGAVALDEQFVGGWWELTALFSYLNDPQNTLLVANDRSRIYLIAPDTRERSRLIEAYLGAARGEARRGSLCEVTNALRPGEAFDGYAHLLQGEWDQAIGAYENAIRSNPDDLWYYPCLARAYQAQGRTEEALDAYRKMAGLLESPELLVEYVAGELGIAPSHLLDYLAGGQAFQTPPDPGTVYNLLDRLDTAHKASPDNATYIRRTAFVIEQLPRGVLFQHPPSRVGYRLEIPSSAVLECSLALAPEVWKPGRGDGVTFKVEIEDEAGTVYRLFSEYIDPKNVPALRRWHDRDIDLSSWSSQVVTLTLSTEPGPNGDDRYDWAGWGEPRIVQRGGSQ